MQAILKFHSMAQIEFVFLNMVYKLCFSILPDYKWKILDPHPLWPNNVEGVFDLCYHRHMERRLFSLWGHYRKHLWVTCTLAHGSILRNTVNCACC